MCTTKKKKKCQGITFGEKPQTRLKEVADKANWYTTQSVATNEIENSNRVKLVSIERN